MKKMIILILLLAGTMFSAPADSGLFLTGDYSTPLNNEILEPNVSFGAHYQFWGIFTFGGNIYTEFIYGEDDFLHIQDIKPLGLFSWGIGIRLPLGGFCFDLDWQKFYRNDKNSDSIRNFCDSYKMGVSTRLSETLGLMAYRRTMYNFTDAEVTEEKTDRIGLGIMLFL